MLSRSTLAYIYDNVKAKTAGTSPSIGSAKRGPLGLHRARSARIQIKSSNKSVFPSVAARSEADETIPKIPRRLLGAFNRTDAVGVPDAASAVPAILAEGILPSAAEAVAGASYTHRVPAQERGTASALSLSILLPPM
jgi:hypothetical protein